jgi:RND family efflux transporter MFP subunit
MKSRMKFPFAVVVAGLALPVLAQNFQPAAGSDAGKDGRIRVQFVAREKADLSSEIAANISSLPFREGDTFKAGQTLVGFDCALYKASLAKAEASAEAARQTLKVNRRLAELNSIGNLQVDQAAAKEKEAEAEATAMRVTVAKCTLRAPFSGRVAKLDVDAHEYVAPGKPLMEILDTRHLELQMIVPSRWLSWLKKGSPLSVRVDELGRDYPARVIRLGARIDPVSQTISVAARVDGDHPELLPGMSGWASMKAP